MCAVMGDVDLPDLHLPSRWRIRVSTITHPSIHQMYTAHQSATTPTPTPSSINRSTDQDFFFFFPLLLVFHYPPILIIRQTHTHPSWALSPKPSKPYVSHSPHTTTPQDNPQHDRRSLQTSYEPAFGQPKASKHQHQHRYKGNLTHKSCRL